MSSGRFWQNKRCDALALPTKQQKPHEKWSLSNTTVTALSCLLEIENLNIHARDTRISLRKLIEDEISEDTLRRLSLTKYVEDGEWLEAVRTFTRAEEDWKERKSL